MKGDCIAAAGDTEGATTGTLQITHKSVWRSTEAED